MGDLRKRLRWNRSGALHDGPRRYLMTRTDVMMGTVKLLDDAGQRAMLDAWAASTRQHGADSLRAYAETVGHEKAALIAATVESAADLGWGLWTVTRDGATLRLSVEDSPFAAGWAAATTRPADQPVCAPIRGMFGALAELLMSTRVVVEECDCAALWPGTGHGCHFVARKPPI